MPLLTSMNTALTCTYHPIGRIKSKNESFLGRQFLPNVSTFQLTHFTKTRLSNQGAIDSSLDKFCKIQEGQNQQKTHETNHLGFLVHTLEHGNMLYSMSSMYKRRSSAGLWRKTLSFSIIWWGLAKIPACGVDWEVAPWTSNPQSLLSHTQHEYVVI